MRALKVLMGCVLGARARVNSLGPWRIITVKT
jgi:hypothetical protein